VLQLHSAQLYDSSLYHVCDLHGLSCSADVGRPQTKLTLLGIGITGSFASVDAASAADGLLAFQKRSQSSKARVSALTVEEGSASPSALNTHDAETKASGPSAETTKDDEKAQHSLTVKADWHRFRVEMGGDVLSSPLSLELFRSTLVLNAPNHPQAQTLEANVGALCLDPADHGGELELEQLKLTTMIGRKPRDLYVNVSNGKIVVKNGLLNSANATLSGRMGNVMTSMHIHHMSNTSDAPRSECDTTRQSSLRFAVTRELKVRVQPENASTHVALVISEIDTHWRSVGMTVEADTIKFLITDAQSLETKASLLKARIVKMDVSHNESRALRSQVQVDRASCWSSVDDLYSTNIALAGAMEMISTGQGLMTRLKGTESDSKKEIYQQLQSEATAGKFESLSLNVNEIASELHGCISLESKNRCVLPDVQRGWARNSIAASMSHVRLKLDCIQQHVTASATGTEVTFRDVLINDEGRTLGSEHKHLLLAVNSARVRATDFVDSTTGEHNTHGHVSINSVEAQYDVDTHLFVMHALKRTKAMADSFMTLPRRSTTTSKESGQRYMNLDVAVGSFTAEMVLSSVSQLFARFGHLHCMRSAINCGHGKLFLNGKPIVSWSSSRVRLNPEREGSLRHSEGSKQGRALDWSVQSCRRRAGCLMGHTDRPYERVFVFFEDLKICLPHGEHVGWAVHDLLMLTRRLNICQFDGDNSSTQKSSEEEDPDSISSYGLMETLVTFTECVVEIEDSELEKSLRLTELALRETSMLCRIGRMVWNNKRESEGEGTLTESRAAEEVDMAFSRAYIHAVRRLRESVTSRMHAYAEEGQALLRLPQSGKQLNALLNEAAKEAKTLDPASADANLQGVGAVNLDLVASNTFVVLRDAEPLVQAKEFSASGPLIHARQAFDVSPSERQAMYKLGRHRNVQDTAQGCSQKAPVKLYSDWAINVTEATGTYSPFLEPALSDLARDVVRLMPKDPNTSHEQKNGSMPSWDVMRYFWRGRMSVTCDSIRLSFHSTISNRDEISRGDLVELKSENAALQLANDGDIHLNASSLLLCPRHAAAKGGELKQPQSQENVGISIVNCALAMRFLWETVGGQDPSMHLLQDSFDGSQKISVTNFVGAAFEMELSINARQERETDGANGKASVNASAMLSVSDSDVLLMRRVIDSLISPSGPLRKSFGRRRYGEASSSKPSNSLFQLMRRFSLKAQSEKTRYIHPNDLSNDPAAGIQLFAKSISYQQEFDSRMTKGNFGRDGQMRSVTQDLRVDTLQGIALGAAEPKTPAQEQSMVGCKHTRQLSDLLDVDIPEGPGENMFPEMLAEDDERMILFVNSLSLSQELEDSEV
jgi:hypothetical protein